MANDRNRDNANPGSQRDNQTNPRDPNLAKDNDGGARQQQADQGRANRTQNDQREDVERTGRSPQQQQGGDKSREMGSTETNRDEMHADKTDKTDKDNKQQR